MKTTITPRLRRLLMACFASLTLATAASSLHAAEQGRIHNEGIYTVAADDTYTNLYESTEYYGGAIHNGAQFPSTTGIPEHKNGSMEIEAGANFTGNAALYGGAIYNNADLTIKNGTETQYTSFNDHNASTIYNGGAIYQSTVGSLYIGDYTRFENNASKSAGSAIHARGGFTAGNNIVVNGNTAGWGAAVYIGLTTTDSMLAPVENHVVTFGSNASFTHNAGGAIYNEIGTLQIGAGATFTNNDSKNSWQSGAIQNGALDGSGAIRTTPSLTLGDGAQFNDNKGAFSGALFNTGTVDMTNAVFISNTASNSGGAITNMGTLTYKVTTNITNAGNTAAAGGFLMAGANSSTTFNISENATLTIGDDTADSDSIASADNTATIIKTGAGTMEVKSSMEYYTGSLDVLEGTMTIAGELAASEIHVAAGATLTSENYSISADANQGLVDAKEGMTGSYVSKDTIKGMSFSKAEVDFKSSILHINNSDLSGTTVIASEILVTGESSITTSSLMLTAENATIKLHSGANLTLDEHTAALIKNYSISQASGATNTTLTYTHSTWTASGVAASTNSMQKTGEALDYAFVASNETLNSLVINGTNVLISDQLTITFEMPEDFDQSTGFTFTYELSGITGVIADFDESNIRVIMGDGAYGGWIESYTFTGEGGSLVLRGEIAPEPSTATLSLLALAGLLARRRRRAV